MANSFDVTDGILTVTFWYNRELAEGQAILDDATHYLWDHGYGDHGTKDEPIIFDDLTNDQKLSLIDKHIRIVIINLANTFKSTEAQRIAREAEAFDEHEFDPDN